MLIDVRDRTNPDRAPRGRAIPLQLPQRFGDFARADVVLHCHHGVRSLTALEFLRQQATGAWCRWPAALIWSRDVDPSVPRYRSFGRAAGGLTRPQDAGEIHHRLRHSRKRELRRRAGTRFTTAPPVPHATLTRSRSSPVRAVLAGPWRHGTCAPAGWKSLGAKCLTSGRPSWWAEDSLGEATRPEEVRRQKPIGLLRLAALGLGLALVEPQCPPLPGPTPGRERLGAVGVRRDAGGRSRSCRGRHVSAPDRRSRSRDVGRSPAARSHRRPRQRAERDRGRAGRCDRRDRPGHGHDPESRRTCCDSRSAGESLAFVARVRLLRLHGTELKRAGVCPGPGWTAGWWTHNSMLPGPSAPGSATSRSTRSIVDGQGELVMKRIEILAEPSRAPACARHSAKYRRRSA